jgi:hypothetical protein
MSDTEELIKGIHYALVSPNEVDSNLEPANVVDGLYMLARAIRRLAEAIESEKEHGRP